MRKVEDITDFRRELPDQEDIQRLANRIASHARLTETRALLVVEIRNGGEVHADIQCSERDKAELLLWIERLKARLIAEE